MAFYIYNKEFGRWHNEEGVLTTNTMSGPNGRYGYSSESEANSAITELKLSTGTDSLKVVEE